MFPREGVPTKRLKGSKIKRLKVKVTGHHNPECGDLIYCQRLGRSANGQTAAHHVGTRRRRLLFLFRYLFASLRVS